MSTDGGATYDSGSNYSWNNIALGGGLVAVGNQNDTSIALANYGVDTTDAANSASGMVTLSLPASKYPRLYGQVNKSYDSGYPAEGEVHFGVYKITTPVTAFQILAVSGNLASGVIRVYGVAK